MSTRTSGRQARRTGHVRAHCRVSCRIHMEVLLFAAGESIPIAILYQEEDYA